MLPQILQIRQMIMIYNLLGLQNLREIFIIERYFYLSALIGLRFQHFLKIPDQQRSFGF